MNNYKKTNTILGWIIFAIASLVYIVTTEPTASFWDCGEYISTAYKLQVGHPPGAPFFQLIGNLFTLFAFGNVKLVAQMVNIMSALCSGFTILFLFWSITMLAKKIIVKSGEMTKENMHSIFGSALVGSLAYTFSDTFWFSAVEGEVYAMSSFFTAIVFWAMLKWEESTEDKMSYKWLILIAYLIGLSIGVHLLNLLTIPAMVFIYYFKKYQPSWKGIISSIVISLVLLVGILYGIIPWIVKLAGSFEIFFINTLGLPFNAGTLIYFAILIGLIIWGVRYTHKHQKVVAHTILLGLIFLLIGYSSFFMLVIRANANTPINQNDPEDAVSLLAYLNREQYGDTPLFFGPYYNAPAIDYKNGTPTYTKDIVKRKYVISDDKKGTIPVYDPRFTTAFPRMWCNNQRDYIENYKEWGKVKGVPISVQKNDGKAETIYKPTFSENLRFFFNYQLGHMYFRYFMWNFVGRQSENQNTGGIVDGNWLSGINWVDEARLGPQKNLPESLQNKGRNTYYFFPFILGLIGFFYQLNKDYKNCIVVTWLFFMTGIAIAIYLNMYAYQPRERDYAFAASFYAFAIWIGIGVMGIYDAIKKKIKHPAVIFITTLLCLILVPGIMAKENWDDHDRSHRYTALDFACNYLNSCAPNAILFTNGDNDTFPLWYAQEVEGIRTDVRVCNLSLLTADWYINQMKRKAYDSDPMPLSYSWDQYKAGTRDYVPVFTNENIIDPSKFYNLKDIMDFVGSNNPRTKVETNNGLLEYFPTNKFRLPVDTAIIFNNGTLSRKYTKDVLPAVEWTLKRNGVGKNSLIVLDFLATNNWERPVYFAITTGGSAYLGLENFFVQEGLTYRLVPMNCASSDQQTGKVNTDVMYDNVMNKFKWGNIQDPRLFLNNDIIRFTLNFRSNFARLAIALAEEGKRDSAMKVCDRCIEVMPDNTVTYSVSIMPIAEVYYALGATDKANKIMKRLTDLYEEELVYFFSFKGEKANLVDGDKQQALAIMQRFYQITQRYHQEALAVKTKTLFEKYYQQYTGALR